MKKITSPKSAFTLIEIIVVIAIIGILATAGFASFGESRAQARDGVRKAALNQVRFALEAYKDKNGTYPAQGCGAAGTFAGPGPFSGAGFANCAAYITGLAPDFISALPTDPIYEAESNRGFYYRSDGTSYKLMAYNVVEVLTVTSPGDEFARCPTATGACAAASGGIPATTYAVYRGAASVGW